MWERLTLGGFLAGLMACVVLGWNILWALGLGLALFCLYALRQGRGPKEIWSMCARGVWTVRNILVVFLLIGMLTATWRAGGTIACIIYSTTRFILPQAFVLITFLLCCLLSFLTGTAFGAAATMGVICMTMGRSLGVSQVLLGGAVLSGVFFGDRSSPMSTSALLVCQLTGTDIYANLKNMFRSAAVPFAATCGVYLALGFSARGQAAPASVNALFTQNFSLHWLTVVPAVLILALALFRIKVKVAMLCSVLAAAAVCLFLQGISLPRLLHIALTGYSAADPELARMMDGGGILSMVRVAAIICISSCYAGIFKATGLLQGLQAWFVQLGRRITPFGSIALASLLTSLVSCNQTLATMLTHQLCGEMVDDPSRLALDLEDTVILMAPLVPWSIAASAPLTSVGAPSLSILAACYLYLVPLWSFLRALRRSRRTAA